MIKKILLYLFGIILPALVFMSCMALGINLKYKTPKRHAILPKFAAKDSLLGFNNAHRSCFNVTHYDINLRFDIRQKSIKGYVTTSFELVNPSDKIQLDLDPQFMIDSIVSEDKSLMYSRKITAITIDLPKQNKRQKVTVYYHGKPKVARRPPWEGGFVWKTDKNKKPFISVACEGEGAKVWLPIKSYLGDEPDSVTTHYTVDKNLVAVSNGNLISVEERNNEKIYTWKTSYLINPYNISLYIGDYQLIETSYNCLDGEKMMLRYYVLADNLEKAKVHFKQTEKILSVYEQLFGKYPWPKDGYKLVESPFAGMEHQTAIAYGNGYKNEKNESYDYIILHETAHEWWGNAVSVADFSDVWIHEGLATYSEALYVEKIKKPEDYMNYTYWTSMMVKNKKPVIGPAGLYYWNYKDGDPYSKGAAMLHTLRNHLNNDTLFFTIIRTFYKEYCYKTADTDDFIQIVNRFSGKDLTYFFKQYLYRRESPYLKWNFDYDKSSGTYGIIYQFDRVGDDFSLNIEVEQGNKKFYITPNSRMQRTNLPFSPSVPVVVNSKNSYVQTGYKKIASVSK